jgi:FKBP-type peptidyl-prolyl cis-trans isomerase
LDNSKKISKKENQKLLNIVLAFVLIFAAILVFQRFSQPVESIENTSEIIVEEALDENNLIRSDVEIITTASGLQYQDLVVGEGAEAEAGQIVWVHYTGYLSNGTEFDSSYSRGTPFDFPLGTGRVIKGWDEGVAGMKIGGKRVLIIPPDLGYGDAGAGGGLIPGDATLIFEVELIEIELY